METSAVLLKSAIQNRFSVLRAGHPSLRWDHGRYLLSAFDRATVTTLP
jgi:hypothetical protein